MVLSPARTPVAAPQSGVLLLYDAARPAAELFQKLSEAGHTVTLCPANIAVTHWPAQLDVDVLLLVAEDSAKLIETCAAVRSRTERPILVLGADHDDELVAAAFGSGIDDYASLAIGERELCARIDALRRRSGTMKDESWQVAGLRLNVTELSVEVHGRRHFLTPIEFRLLACLASAPGTVFTHEALMERVWGEQYTDARHYLYLYIRYLREKLEANPKRPQLIVSAWGVGYRLDAPS
jgi:DNA-binding response OmpR family regulator